MPKFFYDSYAVLSYLSDDHGYAAYFEKNTGVLTRLNLMEIHYAVLRIHGARAAHEVLEACSALEIDFSLPDVEAAMKLRYELRNLELSYADALGYHISKKEGLKFLTGDRAFAELPNVEFVR
ncbi:MAG: PIN domain-containing protein [Thaumarchaeota archaeon]|nr:PIN domain-containing protein [Nitrososphaerota archaeon]